VLESFQHLDSTLAFVTRCHRFLIPGGFYRRVSPDLSRTPGRGPQLNDAGPNEKRALPGASGRNHYSEVTVPLNLDERVIANTRFQPIRVWKHALGRWPYSRIHQQSGHRTQGRLVGNVIVSILSVLEHAGATENEVDNLPAAFTLPLAGLLQSQPRVHLEARGTSGKVRSLCDLPMRADYGQPPERVHLSGWRSQSSPRSFPRNGEC
jgi:hypothetical protein